MKVKVTAANEPVLQMPRCVHVVCGTTQLLMLSDVIETKYIFVSVETGTLPCCEVREFKTPGTFRDH